MTSSSSDIATHLMGVPETLMITLYARSWETQQPDAILTDQKAVEMTQRLDYDFGKFAGGWSSRLGCVLRAALYDRYVKTFLFQHPDGIVVSLGSGLCTRFFRVDNGKVLWYEVDFPEVIGLRQRFFESSQRYHFIAKSILDFSWMDEIQRRQDQPMLILYEGVSMYLTEAENKQLLQHIDRQFAPVEVIFDVLNRKTAENSQRHDTVSKTGASFQWGVDRAQDLETWSPGIHLIEEDFFLTQFLNYPQRIPQPWRLIGQIFPLIPKVLFKRSARIIRLWVGES
jgi:O-methyltransferase involved in polyketide biosynthesis